MKNNIYKIVGLLLLLITSFSMSFAQDDISQATKDEQEQVLKQNPKDFGANYVMGAWYYNQAIDPHLETTKMGLVEYLYDGEPYEQQKQGFLKKALPYFENAYAIDSTNIQVKEVLKSIYQHLGMIPMYKATPEEINQELESKLTTIEFKEVE
jgi:tetratricopeptide (TPR) repeat protein